RRSAKEPGGAPGRKGRGRARDRLERALSRRFFARRALAPPPAVVRPEALSAAPWRVRRPPARSRPTLPRQSARNCRPGATARGPHGGAYCVAATAGGPLVSVEGYVSASAGRRP